MRWNPTSFVSALMSAALSQSDWHLNRRFPSAHVNFAMSHARWLAFAADPPLPHVKMVRSATYASNSTSITRARSSRDVAAAISAVCRRYASTKSPVPEVAEGEGEDIEAVM